MSSHEANNDIRPTSLVDLSGSCDCKLYVSAKGHVALGVAGRGILDEEPLM